MMIASQLPDPLWGEALMHAIWLKNHTWTHALPARKPPYSMLNDKPAILENLPIWGQVIWVHNLTGNKLGAWARESQWVGYDANSNGQRIYWPEKKSVTVEQILGNNLISLLRSPSLACASTL
jgi:hypothetical protein